MTSSLGGERRTRDRVCEIGTLIQKRVQTLVCDVQIRHWQLSHTSSSFFCGLRREALVRLSRLEK